MIDKLLPAMLVAANLDPEHLRTMQVVPVKQIIVAPDCGFEHMSRDIAFA
jgi:methionine synthase II (cobalamin-independent)